MPRLRVQRERDCWSRTGYLQRVRANLWTEVLEDSVQNALLEKAEGGDEESESDGQESDALW